MKQLIPKSKIYEAAKQLSLDTFGDDDNFSGDISTFTNGFNSGVQFALKEITPIMIEFAEWLLAYDRNSEGMWFSPFSSSSNNPKFTTEQLLEQFLKTKTEWN